MRIVAGLVAFSMTVTSAFSFAAGPQCTDVNLRNYMKRGAVEDQAPDKIYRFTELRHDIIQNISDPHKTKCLNDAYQAGLEQEAGYWGKRLAQAGCSVDADGDVADNCPIADEVRESNEFLFNLEHDSNSTIREAIQISRTVEEQDRANSQGAAPTCSNAPRSIQPTALQLHQISCCGSPGEKSGAVRINEPEISYQECLGKIGENTHSVADSVISCAGSLITGAVKAIWEAIKGLWHLPAMIGQVWSLMTSASARSAFFDKIVGFLKAKGQAVYSCYNNHERTQEICRDAGALITMFAAPESTAALIGVLAKPLSVLGRAKALDAILATTSKGKAFLGKIGKGNAAVEAGAGRAAAAAARAKELAAAAAQRTRKLVQRAREVTPRAVKAPIKFTGSTLKKANDFRRWLGRPLSRSAEKAAALASRSGVYKRMLQRAVRSEEQARGRAAAAGGLAARAERTLKPSAALAEATSAATASTGGTSGAGAASGASSSNNIRVNLSEPMPTTPLGKGARLGERPQGLSYSRSYRQTDPLAGRPPLGRGAPLGTKPEGGINFSRTVVPKPAAPAPEVNVNVRFGAREPRPVAARPEPRFEPANPQARSAVNKINEDIRSLSEGRTNRPANAEPVDPASPEGTAARALAQDLHARVDSLKDQGLLTPEEAGRLSKEINGGLREGQGVDLPGARETRRAAARERRERAGEIGAGGKATAPEAAPANGANASGGAPEAAPASGANAPESPQSTVVIRRVVRTERELTDSRNYLDRFSKKVEALSSDPARSEREALRAFQSARPDKIRAEADRLHTQVDDLVSANRITPKQATNYHENISLGESYATKSPAVREWTAPVQPEVPVAAPPVKRLVQPEPVAAPQSPAPVPNEANDFVYPPEPPVAAAPAPLKPSAVQTQPPVSPREPSAPAVPPRPTNPVLASNYQSALDDIAPGISSVDRASEGYLTNKYWRTWAGTGELPQQGWKLHVSATPEKAEKIARLLLPELRRLKIGHKVAADLTEYTARSSDDTQFGKFITIYPKSDVEARRIAALTEKIMKKAGLKASDFPTPPGEQVAGVGVFARYGRLTGGYLRDEHGMKIPGTYDMVRTRDGKYVPDNREQQFEFAGQLVPPKKPGLIQRVRDRFRRGTNSEASVPADVPEVIPTAPAPAAPVKPARTSAQTTEARTRAVVSAAVVAGRIQSPSKKRASARSAPAKPRAVAPTAAVSDPTPATPADAAGPDAIKDIAIDAADAAVNDETAAAAAKTPAPAPTN